MFVPSMVEFESQIGYSISWLKWLQNYSYCWFSWFHNNELTEHVVKSLQQLCIVMQSKSAVSHSVKAVVPKSKLMFQKSQKGLETLLTHCSSEPHFAFPYNSALFIIFSYHHCPICSVNESQILHWYLTWLEITINPTTLYVSISIDLR